jgi:hypothetical protein
MTDPTWTRWLRPGEDPFIFVCCECGLTHQLTFRVHRGEPEFRVAVDHALTKLERDGKLDAPTYRERDGALRAEGEAFIRKSAVSQTAG